MGWGTYELGSNKKSYLLSVDSLYQSSTSKRNHNQVSAAENEAEHKYKWQKEVCKNMRKDFIYFAINSDFS
jgi:hypothetical protein